MKHAQAKGIVAVPGVLFAAYLWLLLDVILGVPIWVAFIAAAGALAAYAAGAVALVARRSASAVKADPRRGDIVVGDDRVLVNPLLNVAALRLRFTLSLSVMLLAGWVIVETLAFSPSAQRWISFACGILAVVFGAASYAGYRLRSRDAKQSVVIPSLGYRFTPWQLLSGSVTVLGIWQIVETLVFTNMQTRWLTFANACALLILALVGLVVHEFSTERVVHVLEVAGLRPRAEEHSREPARSAA
jgi:hypothetical protein